jgi:hypothetical protein
MKSPHSSPSEGGVRTVPSYLESFTRHVGVGLAEPFLNLGALFVVPMPSSARKAGDDGLGDCSFQRGPALNVSEEVLQYSPSVGAVCDAPGMVLSRKASWSDEGKGGGRRDVVGMRLG